MELLNQVYQFENLTRYASIVHGISSMAFGSMKDEASKQIDRDRLKKFGKVIGIRDEIVCMKQIHSGNVSVVAEDKALRIPDTDSLVTNKLHIPLAVLTADCLPILLYDPKNGVVALAHAGYKGLLSHVIEHTVEIMNSQFKSEPKDIIVGIGPGIERDCYEVSVALIEKFQETFPGFENIFVEKNQKYFLDLVGIARQTLEKEGLLKEHIEVMNICTKCDPNFYSYRGGDGDKRFTSVISLI
jgi:purine-nucleoside/S-methyl-5'-thioadenosine phosphorylase / adenosine deaminase